MRTNIGQPVSIGISSLTQVAHRSAVAAPDVMALPGALTTSVVSGGSLVDATSYNCKVVAGNAQGRTTAVAGTARTTANPNRAFRVAFAQVAGATYYDIYLSTDADPKWVGRVTEAQRASGILITAVGVTGAGGIAGAVDVQVAGTGLQSAASQTVNTAYVMPTGIDTRGYQFADFDLLASTTGDQAQPSYTVLPFWYNSVDGNWYSGTTQPMVISGTQSLPLTQRIRVEVRGADQIALVVTAVAGCTVTAMAQLS